MNGEHFKFIDLYGYTILKVIYTNFYRAINVSSKSYHKNKYLPTFHNQNYSFCLSRQYNLYQFQKFLFLARIIFITHFYKYD